MAAFYVPIKNAPWPRPLESINWRLIAVIHPRNSFFSFACFPNISHFEGEGQVSPRGKSFEIFEITVDFVVREILSFLDVFKQVRIFPSYVPDDLKSDIFEKMTNWLATVSVCESNYYCKSLYRSFSIKLYASYKVSLYSYIITSVLLYKVILLAMPLQIIGNFSLSSAESYSSLYVPFNVIQNYGDHQRVCKLSALSVVVPEGLRAKITIETSPRFILKFDSRLGETESMSIARGRRFDSV